MQQDIDWFHKTSKLVISFGVLAVVTNTLQVLFFGFDTATLDGYTYTKDYSPIWQSLMYLGLAGVAAFFIRRKYRTATVLTGLFAGLIGLSTFWLGLVTDGMNLVTALQSWAGGFDQIVLANLFYVTASVVSIILCMMISGSAFTAISRTQAK